MHRLSSVRRAILTVIILVSLLGTQASQAQAQEGGEGGGEGFWEDFPEILCLFTGQAACWSITQACDGSVIPDDYCDTFYEACVQIVMEVCFP